MCNGHIVNVDAEVVSEGIRLRHEGLEEQSVSTTEVGGGFLHEATAKHVDGVDCDNLKVWVLSFLEVEDGFVRGKLACVVLDEAGLAGQGFLVDCEVGFVVLCFSLDPSGLGVDVEE
jgi:hypothetical protein